MVVSRSDLIPKLKELSDQYSKDLTLGKTIFEAAEAPKDQIDEKK